MKLLALLATLAIATSAVIVQIDVELDNAPEQGVSEKSLPFEEIQCIPKGRMCNRDADCCSGYCKAFRAAVGTTRHKWCVSRRTPLEEGAQLDWEEKPSREVDVPSPETEKAEEGIQCIPKGQTCIRDPDCCSGHYCKAVRVRGKWTTHFCAPFPKPFEKEESTLSAETLSSETEKADEGIQCRPNLRTCKRDSDCCSDTCTPFRHPQTKKKLRYCMPPPRRHDDVSSLKAEELYLGLEQVVMDEQADL